MKKMKPSGWFFLLAVLLPIFACVGAIVLVYVTAPNLTDVMKVLDTDDLTRVVVPGEKEIYISESGDYAVYYEYRSVVDGVSYNRNESLPNPRCQLTSQKTGQAVELAPTIVAGNVYTTYNPERAGVLFKRFSIDQPGNYDFSCQYPSGTSTPKVVMAVGPNFILEFFNAVGKPIAAILIGAFVFVCACAISLLIIGIVALKRQHSKKTLASET